MAESESSKIILDALEGIKKKKIALEASPRPYTRQQAKAQEKLAQANLPDWVRNTFGDDARKQREHDSSHQWVRQRRSGDAIAETWLNNNAYSQRDAPQDVLKDALSVAEQNSTLPKWLIQSASNTRENPFAAEFVSRLAVLPQELQDDPYYLLREARLFSASVQWDQLSNEGRRETVTLINRTLDHIADLAPSNPDFIADATGGDDYAVLRDIVLPETEFGQTKHDTDIFEGLPMRDKLPADVRKLLDDIESRGVNNPNDSLTLGRLSNSLDNLKSKRVTGQQSDVLDEYKVRLREYEQFRKDADREAADMMREQKNQARRIAEHHERGESEVPNQISLTQGEVDKYLTDPQGTMDRRLGLLEHALLEDPENTQVQNQNRRTEMELAYLLSDEFDEHRPVFVDGRELNMSEKKALRDEFRTKLGHGNENLKNKILDAYTVRLGGVQFLMQLSSSAELGGDKSDFRNYLVRRAKEKHFFGLDGLYGGLVGDGAHIFQRMYEQRLFKGDELQYITHKDLLDTMDELKTFMKDHPELFMDRFEQYVRGGFMSDRPLLPNEVGPLGADWNKLSASEKKQHYNDAVDAIALLATERQTMFMETIGVNIRGAAPLAEEKYLGGHSTYLTKDKIEQIFRPLRYKVEKWGSGIGIPKGEKAFFQKMAEIHAVAAPEIKTWGQESGRRLYGEAVDLNLKHLIEDHLRELPTQPEHKLGQGLATDLQEKAKHLYGKMQYLYFFNPDANGDDAHFMEFLVHHIDEKSLIRQATVVNAIDIADSHLVHPYLVFESGWRRSEINSQIEENLKLVFGEKTDGLFTANKITGAALEYFFSKFNGDHKEKRFSLQKALKIGARYKPHDLAQVLHERDSEWLKAWHRANNHGNPQESLDSLLAGTSLRATLLQREMMAELQPAIDYSGQWVDPAGVTHYRGSGVDVFQNLSEYQRTITDKVFAGLFNPDDNDRRTFFGTHIDNEDFRKLLFGSEMGPMPDFDHAHLTPDQLVLINSEIRKNYTDVPQIYNKITEIRNRHFETEKSLSDFLMKRDSSIGIAPAETIALLRAAGSKAVGEESLGAIRELCDTRYGPLLSKPRGSDDLPLDLLQFPERVKRKALELESKGVIPLMDPDTRIRFLGNPANPGTLGVLDTVKSLKWKPLPIADYFSQAGHDVQSGMAIRAWRDLGNAEQALNALFELVKPSNAEELDKIAGQLYNFVAPYQGPDVAAMAVVQMVGTWEAEAKASPLMEKMPNSSDFKKYYGSESVAEGADSLRHRWEKVQNRIGKVFENAPKAAGLLETTESVVKISSWGTIIGRRSWLNKPLTKILGHERYDKFVEYLNEHAPSGIWSRVRIPLYGLFIAGFLVAYLVSEATSGGKEKSR